MNEPLSFVESPETGAPSQEPIQAIRSRMWLRAMTNQGEDRIWRGAESTLRYLTQTEVERDHLRDALQEIADTTDADTRQIAQNALFKASVIRAEKCP